MVQLRVAVIDDDWYRREHMRQVLDLSDQIVVVHSLDQDAALAWSDEEWGELDLAVVDVYDDESAGEIGTDLFSGIPALERLRDLDVRTLAIAPHRHHPLIEHRIYQSGADFLYRRWDLNDPRVLEAAVTEPDASRRPRSVDAELLWRYGAQRANTPDSVEVYTDSALHGRLVADATHRSTGQPRRTITRFLERIRSTGFSTPRDADQTREPRWEHTRDYVLRLIGRKDSPPTSHDGQDEVWMR